jgi:hypothetical protein
MCMTSCSIFGPQAQIEVLLPSPPPHWILAFPDLAFTLVFPDGAGCEQAVTVLNTGKPVAIGCSKEANTAILAYPYSVAAGQTVNGYEGMLRPAGGLYPASLDCTRATPTLLLDWKDGAVVTVLNRLHARGFSTSLLNAGRLSRCFQETADPLSLDLPGIEEKLAQGGFSAYDMDPLPCRDIQVKVGAGDWFLESPLSSVASSAEDGALALNGISLGMHGLFSTAGHEMKINVRASETVVLPVR